MALKMFDSQGYGSTSNAVLALAYAIKEGARLTNNSWGGGAYLQSLKDAIDSSAAHGMLFVAAAGNFSEDNDIYPQYPASYDSPNIIAVAATDHNDNLASFSNWGLTTVDLGAPGVDIRSTIPFNSYYTASGTSMAAPHVTGAAALIWSIYPTLSHQQVKSRIVNRIDSIPALGGRCVSGGRLNLFLALAAPDSTSPAAINDLAINKTEATRITIAWTATGDDSTVGRATSYDIRYSLASIDGANFAVALQAYNEPVPQSVGSYESFVVRGLDFSTIYYFAVKALDEWENSSPVSNSPSGTTLAPPLIQVTPDSLSDSLDILFL